MKSKLFFLLFFIILLVPLVDLLHPGFPVTHDGQDHIARIANFYLNLQNGVFIPRWAPNLDWGYGHPILMFLYPLPSYIASFFHALSLSLIDSVKIVFALGMFFSGITMYLWLSSFWGKYPSFLGAVLYVFAPYRFIDLYVRGDIGENLAFVFVPLVFYAIQKISEKKSPKHIFFGAVSFALLILSHNAISLMVLPLILIYIGYKYFTSVKEKNRFIIHCLLLLAFGFGLSAFFWIPGLLEGKYTLRNIVTKGEYKTRFVEVAQLIYGPWNYGGSGQFTVQFGLLYWISLIGSIASLPFVWVNSRKKFFFVLILVFYTFIATFLMLSASMFVWNKFILLQNFQFPWRFLAVVLFTTSVLGAYVLELIPVKFHKLFVIVSIVVLLFVSKDYWHANDYKKTPESFFTGIYNGTTDTGESAPIWSVRFMERQAKSPMAVIDGQSSIKPIVRTPVLHSYSLNVYSDKARIVENTLYFPGWTVFVDGKVTSVEFQDPAHRGLITFFVSKGLHNVVVDFRDTKIRQLSSIISLLSIIFIFSLFFPKVKKRKQDEWT